MIQKIQRLSTFEWLDDHDDEGSGKWLLRNIAYYSEISATYEDPGEPSFVEWDYEESLEDPENRMSVKVHDRAFTHLMAHFES